MKSRIVSSRMAAYSRSREGAWIEIFSFDDWDTVVIVAPVRERGLKFPLWRNFGRMVISRSREGAWIEIPAHHKDLPIYQSLP